MKIFKFGGASVKSAEAVKNVERILHGHDENLVVVVSAMGKTTNLLETLVKAYFFKEEKKFLIFEEFKNYHKTIMDELFDGNGIPESVTLLFTELELKLNKVPSIDFNYEYDQIICFGELVSTQIISDYLNYSGLKNQWIDIRTCLRTDDTFRDASVNWEWTEELV
ncbi:MAG: aspartate kinase, partial [Prolixibacteraceae bacterium]|nr:aspartate kinase [Prolixibacteraceae bacterium]